MDIDLKKVDKILDSYKGENGIIISVMQDIQAEFGYLPKEALKHLSEKTKVPLSQISHIATFYASFSLKPRGRHVVKVCLGTACHLKGGNRIADLIKEEFKIDNGGTTADNTFTLEAVNCLGACALAPLITLDGKYYSKMTQNKTIKLLKSL